ncbi:histone-lysine N-methyltransferase 2D-like isoform X2 [Heptranchias perlo]|uniref:histone-lysine N-methyltransferase 2D-like isoform X2 n=1 Tax=Heptranchias perlo TaxID=212740 RepID=UPI0035595BDC
MEGFSRAASDRIQGESELASKLGGPKQSQAVGNNPIDVNLVDVAAEAAHRESSAVEGRRSGRIRKKRCLSPEVEAVVRRKTRRKTTLPKSKSEKKAGAQFCCDICKSPHITNPNRRGNRLKQSGYNPSPRRKNDPKTGQVLTLCNACGLAFGRSRRPRTSCIDVDADERRKHQDALQAFTVFITELLGDEDAEKLCCPLFVKKPCRCLQNYIKRTGDELSESRNRAVNLLQLLKEAKHLSSLKCYDEIEIQELEKPRKAVGLGNGQRKSKAFEEFVLKNRSVLRNELKLCERATQRILGYSNNFLHKKLKTDPEKGERVERTKGKGALGLLKPIVELVKERCCVDNCVSMARTHGHLLHLWRERASKGQAEARRALAEMLTPSGGSRSNCYRFISWVTGCSHSTIGRVNEQMKRTGGEREPPPHGLKKWWKEKTKTQGKAASQQQSASVNLAEFTNAASAAVSAGSFFPETIAVSVGNGPLPVGLSSLPATLQLQVQQQQIEVLKKQVQVLQQQRQRSYKQLQREATTVQPALQHLQVLGTSQVIGPQSPPVHQPSSVITQQQPVGQQAKATQQHHIFKEGPVIAQILQNPSHSQVVSAVQSIGILQDVLQRNDIQVVVQSVDLPSGITLQNAGNLRPQSQAALLYNIPSNSASGSGNGQCSTIPDLGQVTFQQAPSQSIIGPISQGPLHGLEAPLSNRQSTGMSTQASQLILQAVQSQIQQEQQMKQPQQIVSLQQVDSGTVEGLVVVCSQTQAQQEAPAHLHHPSVQAGSLKLTGQCHNREEQFLKQPAPLDLQQALQLITVTEGDCQTPTSRASAQTPCITTGTLRRVQSTSLPGMTSPQATGSENRPMEQQIAPSLGFFDALQSNA